MLQTHFINKTTSQQDDIKEPLPVLTVDMFPPHNLGLRIGRLRIKNVFSVNFNTKLINQDCDH